MTSWRYRLGLEIFHLGQKLSGRKSLLAIACSCLIKGYWNETYDEDTNGERWLVGCLANLWTDTRITLVDCGANRGSWTESFLNTSGISISRAVLIEPNRALARMLVEKLTHAGAVVVNAACSKSAGRIDFFLSHDDDLVSTTIRAGARAREITRGARFETVEIECVTLDSLLTTGGPAGPDECDHVVLKVDVEGAEAEVLMGAETCLKKRIFDLVQFEFSEATLESGRTLRWFFDWFARHGYVVGRLFPRGVGFMEYHPALNRLLAGNWVAIRRDDDVLRTALSLPGFDGSRVP